jgi:hypothetical protein
VTPKTIEEAHEAFADSMMSRAGIVGVAIGACAGKPCIKLYVTRKTDELARDVPDTYEGFAVEIEEAGEFTARE